MRRNPHRNAWKRLPGAMAWTCHAIGRTGICGFTARTAREQASHADHFEVVQTRGPR